MGSFIFKELGTPPSGTPAYFMTGAVVPKTVDIYKNGKILLQLDKITHVRNVLESKGSQGEQIEWDAYFNWYTDAYKRLQGSKMSSLKDSLQKANEKLKMQKASKTTPRSPPLHPPKGLSSKHWLRNRDCPQRPYANSSVPSYLPSERPQMGPSQS